MNGQRIRHHYPSEIVDVALHDAVVYAAIKSAEMMGYTYVKTLEHIVLAQAKAAAAQTAAFAEHLATQPKALSARV